MARETNDELASQRAAAKQRAEALAIEQPAWKPSQIKKKLEEEGHGSAVLVGYTVRNWVRSKREREEARGATAQEREGAKARAEVLAVENPRWTARQIKKRLGEEGHGSVALVGHNVSKWILRKRGREEARGATGREREAARARAEVLAVENPRWTACEVRKRLEEEGHGSAALAGQNVSYWVSNQRGREKGRGATGQEREAAKARAEVLAVENPRWTTGESITGFPTSDDGNQR